jgi:hypothetical protein
MVAGQGADREIMYEIDHPITGDHRAMRAPQSGPLTHRGQKQLSQHLIISVSVEFSSAECSFPHRARQKNVK